MSKTLPGFETVLAIPAIEINGVPWMITPTGLVDYENPTAAALNVFIPIIKPSQQYASQGGNISCAIEDDLTLGLTDSDTDDSKTICSKGNSSELTFYNFEITLNAKRDGDISGDSLRNLFRDLTRAPDLAYFIAHRVRGEYNSTDLAAIGQEWDFYYAHTDVQVPAYGDGEPLKATQAFVPKNVVNVRHTLTA
jgi:hypothetical protein